MQPYKHEAYETEAFNGQSSLNNDFFLRAKSFHYNLYRSYAIDGR